MRHLQTAGGTPLSPISDRAARWIAAAAAVGVAGLDQATKVWALQALAEGRQIPLLGHALRLQLTLNSGAAFSFGTGSTWVFTLVTVLVVVAVGWGLTRLRPSGWLVGAALALGGGLGNLVDRLVRAPGFGTGSVVDFIAYGDWFIGNVADIAIVVAAGLVFWLTARGVRPFAPRPNRQAGTMAEGES